MSESDTDERQSPVARRPQAQQRLDPTNGLVQPDRHVTLGRGRDYRDVVPVRGVGFGPPAEQQLTVSVDVAPR